MEPFLQHLISFTMFYASQRIFLEKGKTLLSLSIVQGRVKSLQASSTNNWHRECGGMFGMQQSVVAVVAFSVSPSEPASLWRLLLSG